jgi:hypothetical protein
MLVVALGASTRSRTRLTLSITRRFFAHVATSYISARMSGRKWDISEV